MVTKKHFDWFKEYIKKYKGKVNLCSYELFAEFDPDSTETRAHIHDDDPVSRIAYICLCDGWPDETPTKKDIEKIVFHELFELYVNEIITELNERPLPREIEIARHKIVRTVENLLFQNDGKTK